MQYNRDSIEGILDSYEKFKEHVENVLQSAGKSNSIESFDGIWGDNLRVTTAYHGRCGYESEDHSIPLEWIAADPEELKAKIEAKREAERVQAEARRHQERIIAAARQKEADLAQLAKLKAKYEPNN